MTASRAGRHGLCMIGNCRVVGTFVLWQRHCEDAEIEWPVLHVGSGVLYEDAGVETGSSLMLAARFQCLKGRSVETGFVCSFVSTLQLLCGGTVCLSPLIKPVIDSSGPT